jgi:hypothetical protein
MAVEAEALLRDLNDIKAAVERVIDRGLTTACGSGLDLKEE